MFAQLATNRPIHALVALNQRGEQNNWLRTKNRRILCHCSKKASTGVEVEALQRALRFSREGHVVSRKLVPQQKAQQLRTAVVQHISKAASVNRALRQRIDVLAPGHVEEGEKNNKQSGDMEEEERLLRAALQATAAEAGQEVGFLQHFNLHRKVKKVWEVASHPSLVREACNLLGVDAVRLYQDCTFVKEPGFGATNWHSDLNMAPLDTNSFVTCWIPLLPTHESTASEEEEEEEVDNALAPLVFASRSHVDFALPYWHRGDNAMSVALDQRASLAEELQEIKYDPSSKAKVLTENSLPYELASHRRLCLGDATWHHGWTLHMAPPLPDDVAGPRVAIAISYFGDGYATVLKGADLRNEYEEQLGVEEAELCRTPHLEDEWSYLAWLRECEHGDLAEHPQLPLLCP